jgi:hypothetical protein
MRVCPQTAAFFARKNEPPRTQRARRIPEFRPFFFAIFAFLAVTKKPHGRDARQTEARLGLVRDLSRVLPDDRAHGSQKGCFFNAHSGDCCGWISSATARSWPVICVPATSTEPSRPGDPQVGPQTAGHPVERKNALISCSGSCALPPTTRSLCCSP